MISVSEAKELISLNTKLLDSKSIDLYSANGLILAESVFSPIDTPPFNQSAMDGFAFRFNEINNSLQIVGEMAAGDSPKNFSLTNSAIRIFTGALVPDYFDTVVMQEKVELNDTHITIKDSDLKRGANIRLKGSQIKNGELALEKGTLINAGVAGYLASLGINRIKAIPRPTVSIISTGNELTKPGKELEPGKIYESNTYSLVNALNAMGIVSSQILFVKDDFSEIKTTIQHGLTNSDVLILSGGVSVGDYDFVAKALEACGVTCVFHKVKQKPGKPLYFGNKENKLVFGLPGNPAALLTCFYEYVKPALFLMTGLPLAQTLNLPLKENYSKKPGLTHFLKAKTNGTEVEILSAQESYLMNSFANANCLVQLNETQSEFKKGEYLRVVLLT